MSRGFAITGLVGLMVLAGRAEAEIVHVAVNGTVESNVIGGGMTNVPDGAPVMMAFDVDSNNFVNNPNFPTRGYPLILSTFAMTVGGVNVPVVNPQPAGATAYFVLRNNDPVVDGFVLSTNLSFPQPVAVTIPGLAPIHDLDFLRTFANGTALPSLDILDALGTYGLENLSVFNWTIGRFGNPGAIYSYQSITLTPEPGSAAVLLAMGLVAVRRRR